LLLVVAACSDWTSDSWTSSQNIKSISPNYLPKHLLKISSAQSKILSSASCLEITFKSQLGTFYPPLSYSISKNMSSLLAVDPSIAAVVAGLAYCE